MKEDPLANIFGAVALLIVTEMEEAIGGSTQQSMSDAAAVLAIGQQPGLSIDQLRQVLQLSHSGTVRVVDRLSASGLVVRDAGRDGRTVSLRATKQGRRECAILSKRRIGRLSTTLEPLSSAERAQLSAISAKVLRASACTAGEAQRVCRLCDHSVCFQRGGCPVAGGAASFG